MTLETNNCTTDLQQRVQNIYWNRVKGLITYINFVDSPKPSTDQSIQQGSLKADVELAQKQSNILCITSFEISQRRTNSIKKFEKQRRRHQPTPKLPVAQLEKPKVQITIYTLTNMFR
jgi:hypothetical protein